MRVIFVFGDRTAPIAERLEPGARIIIWLDDLSFGPVSDWSDAGAFKRQRAAFWASLCVEQFQDGPWEGLEHSVPYKRNPVAGAVPPIVPTDIGAEAQEAREIVLWSEISVQGLVFYSYLVATLDRIGYGGRLGLRLYRDDSMRALERDFDSVTPAALDRLGKHVDLPAEVRGETLDLWQARVALPEKPDPALIEAAGRTWAKAFDILAGRFPDPATGLSRVEQVALIHTRKQWRKVALIVARAMGWYAQSMDHVGDLMLQDALERIVTQFGGFLARYLDEIRR